MNWIRSDTQSQVLLFMCASVQNYEGPSKLNKYPQILTEGKEKYVILFGQFHKLSCLGATSVCAGDAGSTEIAMQC